MTILRYNAAIVLRILSMTTLLMAPMLIMTAMRLQEASGPSHGVGLALLVTLQRGASF